MAMLNELAGNLWWTWDPTAPRLFETVDPELWAATGHNPVLLLRRLGRRRQHQLACKQAFVSELRRTCRRMRAYLRQRPWFQQHYDRRARGSIAYFSMEYGLHESLPQFAGGLGILAGDHFKSASDLGLPLVGVGIFWRQGYTRQWIDKKGRQADRFDHLRPEDLPLSEACNRGGRPVRIRIPVGTETIVARAWQLGVGRTRIMLLDTNLPENSPRDRRLTDRLYSGDRDTRIRQEIVLGIGGWRLLGALEWPIIGCHLNEGHAAFCCLERALETVRALSCSVAEARRLVAATTVFTTHTPIPEGNEVFAPELVREYLGPYVRRCGVRLDQLIAMARINPRDEKEPFGMTPLALRLSSYRNGVSRLHGEVSRKMWQGIWSRRQSRQQAKAALPAHIGSITNGTHARTWLHPLMGDLLDEYLPASWEERQDQAAVWAAAARIPDALLWNLHVALKTELLDFVRARMQARLHHDGVPHAKARLAGINLDPDALTIGFARRFSTYKRATLIFNDLKRLARLVNNRARPVQIIFAGKAHPADMGGKALVAEVVKHARSPRFNGRIAFLEDYDSQIARRMVAGVDVWLNTPQRPKEASGTSGMKPTLHGGLNLSILDGWWPEACADGKNGWAIGDGRDHDGSKAADRRDATALYQRLERDVVPLFYRRDRGNRPTGWIKMMKRSLVTIPPAFNSHRMVKEYLRRYYLPVLRTRTQ
ncbi:MAG TPA: alpha-glucan family phosphorylase [Phycisphaerae bacterium]|nr:alpha-glucan family phosphorylase [Phycisphaerae bacterium]